MTVLVLRVKSTHKPNSGLDNKFAKENDAKTTPKNHCSASKVCSKYNHRVGRITATTIKTIRQRLIHTTSEISVL